MESIRVKLKFQTTIVRGPPPTPSTSTIAYFAATPSTSFSEMACDRYQW